MRFLAAASLSTALFFSGCARNGPASSNEASTVKASSERKPAPDFTLKDADGKNVSLADYKGKVVLLNFWATWCGPCKVEIPWFVEFEKQYKDKGFAVLGVAMDEEGWEIVRPYIQEKKVNYRVLVGNDSTAELYGGVASLPTTFLIDREGRIASTHVGLVSKSDYQNEINELVEKTHAGRSGAGAVPVAAFAVGAAK
ncbi:MAG: redoxin domain-containing protein [Bryobacteraceae bacterium]|nr:redoxin domain-containing protein [Bryobacteraceae bacterium]